MARRHAPSDLARASPELPDAVVHPVGPVALCGPLEHQVGGVAEDVGGEGLDREGGVPECEGRNQVVEDRGGVCRLRDEDEEFVEGGEEGLGRDHGVDRPLRGEEGLSWVVS